MMTKTDLNGCEVYNASYCTLQDLLVFFPRMGYNAGIYGWNWDAYGLGHIRIITGYRNMTGVHIPYKLAQKYNNLARIAYERHFDGRGVAVLKRLLLRLIRETKRAQKGE